MPIRLTLFHGHSELIMFVMHIEPHHFDLFIFQLFSQLLFLDSIFASFILFPSAGSFGLNSILASLYGVSFHLCIVQPGTKQINWIRTDFHLRKIRNETSFHWRYANVIGNVFEPQGEFTTENHFSRHSKTFQNFFKLRIAFEWQVPKIDWKCIGRWVAESENFFNLSPYLLILSALSLLSQRLRNHFQTFQYFLN